MCVFPKPVTKKNYTELGVMGKVIRKLYAIIKMSNKMSFNILLQPPAPPIGGNCKNFKCILQHASHAVTE